MVYNRSLETIIHSFLLSLNITPDIVFLWIHFKWKIQKRAEETQNIGETQNLLGVREDKLNPVSHAEKFPFLLPTLFFCNKLLMLRKRPLYLSVVHHHRHNCVFLKNIRIGFPKRCGDETLSWMQGWEDWRERGKVNLKEEKKWRFVFSIQSLLRTILQGRCFHQNIFPQIFYKDPSDDPVCDDRS